ncbi:MAG: HNH endonuclease signature motif containing protein [Bacillota bacterium]
MKRQADPLCELCLAEGRVTPAEMVHHKVPLREGGELLDMGNLVSVCRACHAKLHRRPTG